MVDISNGTPISGNSYAGDIMRTPQKGTSYKIENLT